MAKEEIKKSNKPVIGISLSKLMENLDSNYVFLMAQLLNFVIDNSTFALDKWVNLCCSG